MVSIETEVSSESRPASKRTLKAALICEDLVTGRRAEELCDKLFEEVGCGCLLHKNVWNFEGLVIPIHRSIAASAAAAADFVILSVSGKRELPANIAEWIAKWVWLINGRTPVLVTMFGDAPDAKRASSIRNYLRCVTVKKGVDMFLHPSPSLIEYAKSALALRNYMRRPLCRERS